MVERLTYKQEVTGSNPVSPTYVLNEFSPINDRAFFVHKIVTKFCNLYANYVCVDV